MAAEAWLEGSSGVVRRLIHPTTGEDLGDAQPLALRTLAFLRRAHVTALAGSSGKIINATGALSLIALSISGLAARRRAPALSGRKRNALIYHRIIGTLGAVFGILWGATGLYLALPTVFAGALGASNEPFFEWAYQLHTGAAAGLTTRLLWVAGALGLALAAATGFILWWRRVRLSTVMPSELRASLPAPEWRQRSSSIIALGRRRRHRQTIAVCHLASGSFGPPRRTAPISLDSPSR
jgi:uncharacterized iron-regulated membrane protein